MYQLEILESSNSSPATSRPFTKEGLIVKVLDFEMAKQMARDIVESNDAAVAAHVLKDGNANPIYSYP